MSSLTGLAKLRAALWQMEKDLGLEELSRHERDVLYAFHSLAAEDSMISTERVKKEAGVIDMKHATFHRSLKRLLDLGFLEPAPDRKTKIYQLTERALKI